jgi:phosphatidylethanolamine-binding protein (PEBP) family uncharacterized protein
MPKDMSRLEGLNHNTAISDYPDLISDSDVVMGHAKVIPDVINKVTDKATITLRFEDLEIENGTQVPLEALGKEPQVEIKGASDKVYSLLLVDPDMPSPTNPKYKDTLYWMVNNIKGSSFDEADFTVEFMPPEPGSGGTHRYVALLFHQPRGFHTFKAPDKRVGFQTRQWAKDHGMGDPDAAVYFKCKHE